MKHIRIAMGFVLIACASAHAQDISVTLSPPNQQVRKGAAPRFEVLVRAINPVRMLDFGSRLDLRERLVKPRFVQDKDLTDTPIHFHELMPVADSDYVRLERGNSLAYETDGSPLEIPWLPPGDYVLQLRVYTNWAARFVESNKVRFTVVAAPGKRPAPPPAGARPLPPA
jgi:hypothetical protein